MKRDNVRRFNDYTGEKTLANARWGGPRLFDQISRSEEDAIAILKRETRDNLPTISPQPDLGQKI